MPTKSRARPKPSEAPPPQAATAEALDRVAQRVIKLLERWLDIFESLLDGVEARRGELIEAAAPKLPEAATLRELVNAITLCLRVRQLAALRPTPEGTDDTRIRRDLEALERALSETAG